MERMQPPLPKTLLKRLGDIVFGAKDAPGANEFERSSGQNEKGRPSRRRTTSERLMDLIFGPRDEGGRK